jgi:hypothetical protein
VACQEEDSGESCGGGRPGSNTLELQATGGGARITAMASGGEARLGQAAGATWKGQGWPARDRGRRRWSRERHVDGAEQRWGGGGGTHGRVVAAACGREETEEGEREVDEGVFNCNFREMQGLYCNASITFKPVLKWKWAQKQKCRVFQNVQLCFKVHLQKCNSFDTNTNLSKVFKLYVNPINKTTLHIYPMCSFTYIYNLNISF